MKTNIKNIELIHKYIDKILTQDEKKTVENQLQEDREFQNLYKDQLMLIQGVKRTGLKHEIQMAKQSYFKLKWLKISGISLSFLVVPLLIWMTFFETSQIETSKPIIDKTLGVSNMNVAEEMEQQDINIIMDCVEVEVNKPEKTSIAPLIEPTQITSQDFEDEKESIKVVKSVKTTESIRLSLDSISVEKKSKVVLARTEREFSESLEEGKTLDNPEKVFTDGVIGNYEMRIETKTALFIDKLTLNSDGSFEFHEYARIDERQVPETNVYGKGTWALEKNLIIFSASGNDFDEKYTLNFNNIKARCITKSPRDKSNRNIKTSIRFYESEIFWMPKRTLLKMD